MVKACLLISVVGVAISLPQQTFRTSSDAVIVTVTVSDRGHLVPALRATDFHVTDNAVPQSIVSLSVESRPLDVTMLLDCSASSWNRPIGAFYEFRAETVISDWLTKTASQVRSALHSKDRLEILTFATNIKRAELNSMPSQPEPAVIDTRHGRTALLDSIALTFMQPGSIEGRRVILVVTDGRDTASVLDDRTQLAIADRSDAALFVVAVGGRYTLSPPQPHIWIDGYEGLLESLAVRSGGRLIELEPKEVLTDEIKVLLDTLRSSYAMAYVPTDSTPGWHQVNVSVVGRKYEVHSKRGYWREVKTR